VRLVIPQPPHLNEQNRGNHAPTCCALVLSQLGKGVGEQIDEIRR
jgi:hypothetical protein